MSALEILPLQHHEFSSLPAGFEYPRVISQESNTDFHDEAVYRRDCGRCVVCGTRSPLGIQRVQVVEENDKRLWDELKARGFIPPSAKSAKHESRNSISLCLEHDCDFNSYHFFIRWVPSLSAFIFVNFCRFESLEPYHGKRVALDANHPECPFPAPFLLQEMHSRGAFPWCGDRAISRALLSTRTVDVETEELLDVESDASSRPDIPTEAGRAEQELTLDDPLKGSGLMDLLQQQWEQLPNWTAANIEGQSWDGTAEENAKKYVDLFCGGHDRS